MRGSIYSLTIVLCLLFDITSDYAQTKNIANNSNQNILRRNPLVGLHFTESKFTGANSSKFNGGYQLSFLNGISGKYDYMIQLGSISTNNNLKTNYTNDTKDLVHNIQGTIMRRFFHDSVFVNPFFSLGAGLNLYNGSIMPTIAEGAGIQVKLAPNIYLFTSINHYWNMQINNSWQGNVGLMGTIYHRKKKKAVSVFSLNTYADIDTDGDGILDKDDSCPTIRGSIVFHGCPDSDGDGIPDSKDSCVNIPGFSAYKGCPPPVIKNDAFIKIDTAKTVIADSILLSTIASNIHFEFNSTQLTDSSKLLLKKVVAILTKHPSYFLLINGHTDNIGNDRSNEVLSVQRANAVKDFLMAEGINGSRLVAEGFGARRPLADNSTEEGRRQNRRTEFILKPELLSK